MKTKSIALGVALAASTVFAEAPDAPKQQPAPKQETQASDLATQLKVAKQELANMRLVFIDQHPSVKAQLDKIADLENAAHH